MNERPATTPTTERVFGVGGLELSVRAQNVLAMEGVTSIQQARDLGYEGLLRLPRMGARVAREVWQAVSSRPKPSPLESDQNTPLRMHLALKILREWGMGENVHDGVVATIRDWIDGGKLGPIPWPGGAFFEEWAAKEGLTDVDGFVGLRFRMKLVSND